MKSLLALAFLILFAAVSINNCGGGSEGTRDEDGLKVSDRSILYDDEKK